MAAPDPESPPLDDPAHPPLPPHPDRTPLLAETEVDLALRRLEAFLAALGYSTSPASHAGVLLPLLTFLALGVAVPGLSLYLSVCPRSDGSLKPCEEYQNVVFEISVYASKAVLAVLSLGFVSRSLRKYGVRRFLFVDRDHGQLERFRKGYVGKIRAYFGLILWWILPCAIVEIIREIMRFNYVLRVSMWKAVVLLITSITSWIYLTVVFLSACLLYNLVCNLQVIHFDDFARQFDKDVVDLHRVLEDHIRLRYYLSKISHRFRVYLLLLFFAVTASEIVTLIQTTGYKGVVNFSNAGDFAVSAVVQVVGLILCLNAASKISHRAQGIASLASKWHAVSTCSSNDSSNLRITNSCGNLEGIRTNTWDSNYSESDLESLDNFALPISTQLPLSISAYNKRQAIVMYLQFNPGGITIFGWTVDRGLINTIFFIELSLVLFVLGKTIVSFYQ